MNKDRLTSSLYQKVSDILDSMKNNPDSVSENDRDLLSKLYSKICKPLGISEHSRWEVQWRIEKWADTARKIAGFAPDEVCVETQNVILDVGAEALLKLIIGDAQTSAFGTNAYIFVGNSNTAESASHTGLQGTQKTGAKMDGGYPQVNGRTATFRATFSDSQANYAWREIAIVNGNNETTSISMNRKVVDLGTKSTGTWTIQIILSLVSA